jgi:methylornithine synthase
MQEIELRNRSRLKAILARAVSGCRPDASEIRFLLRLSNQESLAALFAAARKVRSQCFGNKIFLYGFLYFNTFCRNDCLFCHYRKSNTSLKRYRKSLSEIIESAMALSGSGVHLIDLTTGESSDYFDKEAGGAGTLVDLVRAVKSTTGLPVMVSPGVVPHETLKNLAYAGADWYACYQETHNRRLFAQLRVGQSFEDRMCNKMIAKRFGLLIEEGILIGTGESIDDIVHSITAMRELSANQVRVMTFVPQHDTPMGSWSPPDTRLELNCIAVLRLFFPDKLIPASLDIDGLAGLEKRIEAGANVVTSLIVPGNGFAGVANMNLDIEQARRTPQAIQPIIEKCGLKAASKDEYLHWLERQRSEHSRVTWQVDVCCEPFNGGAWTN